MTLEEVKFLPREFLTPKQVASVLNCNPYLINIRVKNGTPLGFPAFMSGNRVKIPKAGFVNFMEGRTGENEQ